MSPFYCADGNKYKPHRPSSPQDKSTDNSQGDGDGKRKASKFLVIRCFYF